MRKLILGGIILSILPLKFNFAQIQLAGQVIDSETNHGIPGATVYIEDVKKIVRTDKNGNYIFENLKPGEYFVMANFSGFKSISKQIDLVKDTLVNFILTPSVTELNEIVVTGITRSTERKNSPLAIKAIGSEFLQENSASNLIDGLTTVPGIAQLTTGTSISKPMIRGLGFNRVLVLNNGIRQEGQQWGDEHGVEIDEYSVDRVEIVKGPGSLVYGSDGIAGVINFLPPKILSEGDIKSKIITNYQSNGNRIGYSLLNSGMKNGFQWLGQFSNKFAGNYSNRNDGKVYNSGFSEINGKLFLGLSKDWGHTHLTLSSFNTDLGIIEGERDSLGNFTVENQFGETITASKDDYKGYKIGFPKQKINHFSAVSNNYFILKKGILNADIGVQQNHRREYEDPSSPEEVELYLRLTTLTYNLRYHFDKIKNWETTIGINGMYQDNTNKGEEFLIPDYSLFDVGTFVFTQRTFQKISLAGGIRFDTRFLNSQELFLTDEDELTVFQQFERINRNFYGFSGSLGISYRPTESSTFKLNLSRGYRAPNIAELASNGIHEGTFRYEVGNPNLKPESSNQIDLGYYLDSEHITFEITPFLNYLTNYIFLQRSENQPDSGMEVPHYEFTSGNALLYGGEVYLDFHPHPWDWLHIANSVSFVRGIQPKYADSMRFLPNIPTPRYRGELKAEVKQIGKLFTHNFFKFTVDHYFKQDKIYSAYQTEYETPAYTLLGIGIGTTIKTQKRNNFIQLSLHCNNLLDVAYQDHLNRLKYAPINLKTGKMGVFNPGRNFSIKLILNV